MTNNKYLVEVLKNGQWRVVGSSKTEELANVRGISACKQMKGTEYRVTER